MNGTKSKRRRGPWERNICLIQGKLPKDNSSDSLKHLSKRKYSLGLIFNSQNDSYRMHSKRPFTLLFLSFRNIRKPTETNEFQFENLFVIQSQSSLSHYLKDTTTKITMVVDRSKNKRIYGESLSCITTPLPLKISYQFGYNDASLIFNICKNLSVPVGISPHTNMPHNYIMTCNIVVIQKEVKLEGSHLFLFSFGLGLAILNHCFKFCWPYECPTNHPLCGISDQIFRTAKSE